MSGQYILSDPYEVVHTVSPGAHHGALRLRHAIHLAQTVQIVHDAKSIVSVAPFNSQRLNDLSHSDHSERSQSFSEILSILDILSHPEPSKLSHYSEHSERSKYSERSEHC